MSLAVVLVCSAMFVERVIGRILSAERETFCCGGCRLDVVVVEVVVVEVLNVQG